MENKEKSLEQDMSISSATVAPEKNISVSFTCRVWLGKRKLCW